MGKTNYNAEYREAEKRAERYQRLKSEHRCTFCGKQDDRTLSGKTLCIICASKKDQYYARNKEKIKQRHQDFFKFLKDHHLCIYCHRKDAYTLSGRAVCSVCAEKRRNEMNKRYDSRVNAIRCRNYRDSKKRAGLCVACGKRPPVPGKVLCSECALDQKLRYRRRKDADPERNGFGYCPMCKTRHPMPSKKVCYECREKLMNNLEKARAAREIDAHPWRRLDDLSFYKKEE